MTARTSRQGVDLLQEFLEDSAGGHRRRFIRPHGLEAVGDPAYDTLAFYDAATERGAKVVVPPIRTARLSRRGPRSRARDRAIRQVAKIGRRQWKKTAGYHRQARVENAILRYKSILGDGLRARAAAGQEVESVLACNVLNRMTELGRPESFAIAR